MSAQQETGVAVVICGMPSSGNRLLQGLLQAHRVEAAVHHYGSFAGHAQRWQREGRTVAAIWPVRDEGPHRSSIVNRQLLDLAMYETYEDARHAHFFQTVSLCAELRIPLLPVSYSQVVLNPNGMGRMVLGWLGLAFAGWPTEVFDGDRKYLDDPAHDPRAAAVALKHEDRVRAETLAADPSKEILVPISASLQGRASTMIGRLARSNGEQQDPELAGLGQGET